MNSATCKCKSSSSANLLERPRYYPRQLVTPDILTLGQDYLRNKQRIHNRMLHGWGVVCGLLVCHVPRPDGSNEPWKVRVLPGYALAPSGDGILVECEKIVDLRDSPNCADPCAKPAVDPWCSEVYVPREPGVYYIAIRYTESMVRPERVQPAGCGCNDQRCENSRYRDGYEIGVLCDCPIADMTPPAPDFASLFHCDKMACPECVAGPWVGLARVEVGDDGTILVIDNCGCRRLVVTFANFWWKCDCATITLALDDPKTVVTLDREKPTDVTIKASGVDPNATIWVPRGVSVDKWSAVAGGKLKVTMTAAKDAAAGPRTIVVSNPGCNLATLAGAITVAADPASSPRPKRVITPRP